MNIPVSSRRKGVVGMNTWVFKRFYRLLFHKHAIYTSWMTQSCKLFDVNVRNTLMQLEKSIRIVGKQVGLFLLYDLISMWTERERERLCLCFSCCFVSFTYFYCKRVVLDDGITTVPLNIMLKP